MFREYSPSVKWAVSIMILLQCQEILMPLVVVKQMWDVKATWYSVWKSPYPKSLHMYILVSNFYVNVLYDIQLQVRAPYQCMMEKNCTSLSWTKVMAGPECGDKLTWKKALYQHHILSAHFLIVVNRHAI